jgi:hypothetical protein
MHISILKCGPGLLFIGLRWPSVQVEFDMPALAYILPGVETSPSPDYVQPFGREANET